jgi:glutathione S-transferase
MLPTTESATLTDPELTLIGRSSSSFTRLTRIFAAEFAVPYAFRVVPSLLSLDPRDYGGNPALKMPALHTPQGTWFGATNICRVLSRRAGAPRRVVWPEQLDQPLTANAQELTLAAMSTEVAVIMSTVGAPPGAASAESAHAVKMRASLLDTLAWLDAHLERVLEALPSERDLSYLEVALFCLVTHLEFRNVLPVAPDGALGAFCRRFAERPSAAQTPYRFDA